MIEVSLYYVIGTFIGMPILTTIINKYYYDKKREKLILYYQTLIKEEQEHYKSKFEKNRAVISKFMETRLQNIK